MRKTFADRLLAAVTDESLPDDVKSLLRRAALRLKAKKHTKNLVVLDTDIQVLVDRMARALGFDRSTTVNALLSDWLISHGHVVVELMDEDTETKGSA